MFHVEQLKFPCFLTIPLLNERLPEEPHACPYRIRQRH